jgi:hypoxanthine phosphoribosyltransferase
VFLSDLARKITLPHRIEFMAVSSYKGVTSSGSVKIIMDLRQDIEAAHVIVVEDIVDTGRTLAFLVELLQTRGPASVQCCALVRKPSSAVIKVDCKYIGFEMDPVWVVGYGLDYNEMYRCLPYIGELSKDAIERGKK